MNLKRMIVATLLLAAVAGIVAAAACPGAGRAHAESRNLRFTYQVAIGPIEKGTGPVHIFVPLARDTEQQTVLSRTVTSTVDGVEAREAKYGNEFWHGSVERSTGEPIEVAVEYTIRRRPFAKPPLERSYGASLSPAVMKRHARFLESNDQVPVAVAILEPILADVHRAAGSEDLGAIARAIYDWIVANVEYKKVGTGWGNGNTYWACNERYGNCTDFHSLFNSLARTEGIPARFEIGFSIPEDRRAGEVGGYHCWSRFYLPEVGWTPIDASEAFKNPAKKELFYGRQAVDRIHFTTGRDLRLGDGHQSGALNYFIYPHVEVGGERYDGPMAKRFLYEEIGAEVAGN